MSKQGGRGGRGNANNASGAPSSSAQNPQLPIAPLSGGQAQQMIYNNSAMHQMMYQQQHQAMQAAARPGGGIPSHAIVFANAPNQPQQQPAAKRQRNAGAGGLPPQVPGLPTAVYAARAGAELKQKTAEQQRLAARRLAERLPKIERPANPEEKRVLPKPRIAALVEASCGQGVTATSDAEIALKALANEFVSGAISFALAMARRRGSTQLEATDIALYMRQTWGVEVPGLTRGQVSAYRRLAGSEEHRTRMKAVRRGNGGAFLKAVPAEKKKESAAQRRRRQQQEREEAEAAQAAAERRGGKMAAREHRVTDRDDDDDDDEDDGDGDEDIEDDAGAGAGAGTGTAEGEGDGAGGEEDGGDGDGDEDEEDELDGGGDDEDEDMPDI